MKRMGSSMRRGRGGVDGSSGATRGGVADLLPLGAGAVGRELLGLLPGGVGPVDLVGGRQCEGVDLGALPVGCGAQVLGAGDGHGALRVRVDLGDGVAGVPGAARNPGCLDEAGAGGGVPEAVAEQCANCRSLGGSRTAYEGVGHLGYWQAGQGSLRTPW